MRTTPFVVLPRRRGSGGVVAALVAVAVAGALTACSGASGGSSPSPPATSPPPSTSVAPTSDLPTSDLPTSDLPTTDTTTTDASGVVPSDLVGSWQSLDQGSAEVLYRIHEDGSFERAEVMMQPRTSGTFEMQVATKGTLSVEDGTLRVRPSGGWQTLHDPDSPSGSYDHQPLDDLSVETYQWSFDGPRLVLVGPYGAVPYERAG
ncbi:hypothetical protein [Intrasporangium sp. YIM S08009]|uniref:hypothetical protein n=1 Tax=Intrasporangium zincisolvens TaxID=3080018 RepID=UPI002B05A2AA|nr:hypothetical protein [Intrasporangium sp. YIM S08009]